MTGKLLPTGSALDLVTLPSYPRPFHVSCVDAANPFIFVDAVELGLTGSESTIEIARLTTATLMEIRSVCSVRMGLAKSIQEAAMVLGTPKIAIVGPPSEYSVPSASLEEKQILSTDIDIWARPFSMGRPHATIQMTGAVCLGAASAIPGTLVERYVSASHVARLKLPGEAVVVGHASGTMAINSDSSVTDGQVVVKSGSVYRTARRLMEGSVLYMA